MKEVFTFSPLLRCGSYPKGKPENALTAPLQLVSSLFSVLTTTVSLTGLSAATEEPLGL